jgi:hypothetical protein
MKIYVQLLVVCMLWLSCTGKKEQMLCKTWIVSDVRFTNIEQALVHTDTIKGNELETRMLMIREMLMKNVYAFRDDGTYRTGNAVASADGKWKLSGNAIKFISDNKDIKPKLVDIEYLGEDSLLLNMDKDKTSLSVVLLLVPISNQ